jgi:hypothetical protein
LVYGSAASEEQLVSLQLSVLMDGGNDSMIDTMYYVGVLIFMLFVLALLVRK